MKIWAVILSLYVMMLSTVVYCPDYCTDGDETHTEQSDCSDCCLPFMLCNTCAGFVVEDNEYVLLPEQKIIAETNAYISDTYISPFLAKIWQPPKYA
ncbi:MAG: hypothetical protein LBS03_06480 [Bacteroidales bacterium]|jgi:hypothetical protein|nr:hypothetical protein [Bacteroidales bacterium]